MLACDPSPRRLILANRAAKIKPAANLQGRVFAGKATHFSMHGAQTGDGVSSPLFAYGVHILTYLANISIHVFDMSELTRRFPPKKQFEANLSRG